MAVPSASRAASPDSCVSILAQSTPRETPTAMSAGGTQRSYCSLYAITCNGFHKPLTWSRSAAVARRSTALYQCLAVYVVDIPVASDYSSVTLSTGVYVVPLHAPLEL